MKISILFLSFVMLGSVGLAAAQMTQQEMNRRQQIMMRQQAEKQLQNDRRDMEMMQQRRNLIGTMRNDVGPPARRLKISKEDKKLLLPGDDLKDQYAGFLKLSKTNLIKLMPDNGCNYSELVIDASEKCLKNTIPGAGAYYSFRRSDYVLPSVADLRFNNQSFSVAGRFSGGILVSLGDVPMEKLTAKSDGIKFLTDFAPETTSDKINRQMTQFQNGFKNDNFLYARSMPLNENSVYAVRIIAYQSDELLTHRRNIQDTYDAILLDEDKRIDLTAIFRVVKVEADGSVCVLWRELAHSDAPKLIIAGPPKK